MSRGEFTAESAENAEKRILQYDGKGVSSSQRALRTQRKIFRNTIGKGEVYRGGRRERGEKDGIGICNL